MNLDSLLQTLTLQDYTTRVVVVGTTLLGTAAGLIGTFAYLRKRSLMGDALSHATLPGIAIAFLISGEKNLPLLIVSAAATGVLGVLAVIGIRRFSRIKEDAAIGIVLSVFFGVGMVLFSLIQQQNAGDEAGLQTFIYGRAASMLGQDARLIAWTALAVTVGVLLMFKEFRLVCFDQQYAAAQGWPILFIDLIMMALVVLTTVIGLQAVGLIMIVALLIIPAAAARFWTDHLLTMTLLAGLFGALSGWLGSTTSAMVERMPAGAIIVLSAGVIFVISTLFAPRRGIIATIAHRWSLRQKVLHQNLLRAFAEIEEQHGEGFRVKLQDLAVRRSWAPQALKRILDQTIAKGEIHRGKFRQYALTPAGRPEARRILRNHRLWEMYLIRHADIAPSHVDRDADEVEHVLSSEIIAELEQALAQQATIPPSPHHLEVAR